MKGLPPKVSNIIHFTALLSFDIQKKGWGKEIPQPPRLLQKKTFLFTGKEKIKSLYYSIYLVAHWYM